jgi:predicted CXXCH cytochrome family protein
MLTHLRIAVACVLLAAGLNSVAETDPNYSSGGVEQCLSCHDFGPESPVHNVLAGSHGSSDDDARHGCEDCHGPSAAHTQAPTKTSPAVSFGPRWTATTAAQDEQCLACHEDNIASHWKDALHMINNLTCVTCHDIHAEQDAVMFAQQQAEVCTVCHKAQKTGIHGMARRAKRNPPCTQCHNPHDHESAQAEMLKNQSAGCSHCHDLVRMADSSRVSDSAKSYHKVMTRPGSTCLQCHQGIAHAGNDSTPPMRPNPTPSKTVTLFYPGLADSEWLTQAHPGSQPLRQGSSCQQCHRGEEATLGEARSGDFQPASREVQVAFSREGDQLLIALQWQGSEQDAAISLMWGDGSNTAFQRGGCFAACHSDLPGMARNRGQQISKYLAVSRAQQQQIGQPPIIEDETGLQQLMDEGNFVEMWRVRLDSTMVEKSLVLAETNWQPDKLIQINKSYRDGQWRVALRRNMHNTKVGLNFMLESKYTFGIALNGASNPGHGHWVSLPLTLSFGGDETDFTAE